MEYYFSRHAKRRAKLYNLELDDIIEILKDYSIDNIDDEYQFELIDSRFINKYTYPLKIVAKKERFRIVIITNYPLKKETI